MKISALLSFMLFSGILCFSGPRQPAVNDASTINRKVQYLAKYYLCPGDTHYFIPDEKPSSPLGPRISLRLWGGSRLTMEPVKSDYGTDCNIKLLSPGGKIAYEETVDAARISDVTGDDINRDGLPELVIEVHFGQGNDCCFGTYIFVLGANPRLLDKTGILEFDQQPDGRTILWEGIAVTEGARNDQVWVWHCFEYDGTERKSAGREFRKRYDQEIAKNRQSLAVNKSMKDPERAILIEEIAASYLYSARPQRARHELDQLPDPSERKRIWKQFLSTLPKDIPSH